MSRKLVLLTLAAMAFAAAAASPAWGEAGKQWLHHDQALANDAQVHFEGKLKFSNVTTGGSDCPATALVQLTKGTSHAHVDQLTLNPGACVLNGLLFSECQAMAKSQPTSLPWTGTGTTPAGGTASIDITKVALDYTFTRKVAPAGNNCPHTVTLEDPAAPTLKLTFDKNQTATTGQLSGSLTATAIGTEGELLAHLGNVTITGTLSPSAKETYGLGVPNQGFSIWYHHDQPLKSDADLHLEGQTKFSNVTMGGLQCPVTMSVQLKAFQNDANITAFKVTNTAGCALTGLLATECQALTHHTAEPDSLPWTGTGTTPVGGAASVDVTKVEIFYTFTRKVAPAGNNCPHTVTLEDPAAPTLKWTLDKHQTASTLTVSGSLTATAVNTDGDQLLAHLGNVTTTGTLHLTEKETYGLGPEI